MTVDWNDSYLTGHKEIDDDHRTILLFINGIEYDVKSGANVNTLRQSISSLIGEIEEHFKREERVMKELGAPLSSIKKIQEEHQILWEKGSLILEELYSTKLEKNQKDKCLEIVKNLEQWFVLRITEEDMIIKELINKTQSTT